MSSVTVITGIIILLAALVCYAFTLQTIQNKREKRKRILAALSSQTRSFKFILNGCPDGFLTKELKLIVLRSLIDVTEQLTRLEPKETVYAQDLKLFAQSLAETQRETPSQNQEHATVINPQQVKEIKMSLEELHRFVFKLEGQGRVTKGQGEAYRNQIKQLVLHITVDGYMMHGQAARKSEKNQLALHYYDLALKLMIREGKQGVFDKKMQSARAVIEELKHKLSEENESSPDLEDIEAQAELDNQWDKFSEDTQSSTWKKKQVYD